MKILIVEDEELLARAMKRGLERKHHTVLVADTTAKADQVLAAEPGIQLILLDTNLPGEDGPVWFFRNQQQLADGGIRVIAMSGLWVERNSSAATAYDQAGIPRLAKPFEMAELLSLLHG